MNCPRTTYRMLIPQSVVTLILNPEPEFVNDKNLTNVSECARCLFGALLARAFLIGALPQCDHAHPILDIDEQSKIVAMSTKFDEHVSRVPT